MRLGKPSYQFNKINTSKNEKKYNIKRNQILLKFKSFD